MPMEYERGWNAAIVAAAKLIEDGRDQAYETERWAKKHNTSSLPSGYRADGLRDIAVSVRSLLRAEGIESAA